ncbi:hypothetical protein [uncultured Ornithinimicrobium sp.]|uniref:hypothetical protein n=1 Tax=uncultured Ornithinimicrobium sp. TaxID=259307 RepID=UPI0025963E28|nr:hypothetical protein [uncultured Ornithinimicrobium sp.]
MGGTALRTRGRPRAGDRGAASIEQAGVTFLVAVLLGAVMAAPAADIIGPNVAYAVCRAFAALPGTSSTCVSPEAAGETDRTGEFDGKCTVRQVDSANGYGGNLKIFTASKGTSDQVKHNGDGSSSVTLAEEVEGGVGVKGKVPKGKGKGKGKDGSGEEGKDGVDVKARADATVGTSLKYTYNFPEEYGGADAAEGFRDDRRGGWKQYAQTAVPGSQTIGEGYTRAVNGVSDAWHWAKGKAGFPDSPEEEAARDRAHRANTADAVTADLSLQGTAGIDITSGLVDGGAEISASVSGSVTAAITTDGPDRGSNSFTGTVKWDGRLEATLGVPGDPTRGLVDLPPFLNVSPGAGGTGTYTVKFDEDGNPVELVMASESRESIKGGATPPAVKGVSGKARAHTGTATEEKWILDLTDPTNRQLYDNMFVTGGVTLPNGTVAKVAVPRAAPVNDPALMEAWTGDAAALWGRTQQDGVVIRSNYDIYGTDLSAKVASEDGVGVGVAGVSWSDTETVRQLTGATVQDMRSGNPARDLASCGS